MTVTKLVRNFMFESLSSTFALHMCLILRNPGWWQQTTVLIGGVERVKDTFTILIIATIFVDAKNLYHVFKCVSFWFKVYFWCNFLWFWQMLDCGKFLKDHSQLSKKYLKTVSESADLKVFFFCFFLRYRWAIWPQKCVLQKWRSPVLLKLMKYVLVIQS